MSNNATGSTLDNLNENDREIVLKAFQSACLDGKSESQYKAAQRTASFIKRFAKLLSLYGGAELGLCVKFGETSELIDVLDLIKATKSE